MKSTADHLVLVLAASVAALGSSCTSGKRGGVDGSARADASFCVFAGKSYAVGENFPAQDNCNTCYCGADLQVMCTTLACLGDAGSGLSGQDASPFDGAGSAAGCFVSTTLTFGHDGGNVLFQDSNSLDASGIMTVTRKPVRGYRDGGIPSCSWELPACGTPGAVTLATIAADLADADVQAAFAASSAPLYGLDDRPSDGTVYSIALADGRTVLVGRACSSRPSEPCQEIPAGVERLAQDLASLATAALAAPACQGL